MIEPIRTRRLELTALTPSAIRELISGRREEAERQLQLALPSEFPTPEDLTTFLPIQLHRMETHPDRQAWMARLMLAPPKTVVGHCGFHGPPDVIGRAEIGYTVFEGYRGQGYAKEAARGLIDWAFEQGEHEVYASVSPDNAPSLAVVKALGFTQVGTQDDEIDGLELVFAVRRPPLR